MARAFGLPLLVPRIDRLASLASLVDTSHLLVSLRTAAWRVARVAGLLLSVHPISRSVSVVRAAGFLHLWAKLLRLAWRAYQDDGMQWLVRPTRLNASNAWRADTPYLPVKAQTCVLIVLLAFGAVLWDSSTPVFAPAVNWASITHRAARRQTSV